MTYALDGVAEQAGAAAGIDNRRIRGDLERFRDLVEARRSRPPKLRDEVGAEPEQQTVGADRRARGDEEHDAVTRRADLLEHAAP